MMTLTYTKTNYSGLYPIPVERILFFLTVLLFISCSKSPSKVELINSIKDVKKLATTEFVFSKYILAQKKNQLAFITVGKSSFGVKTVCYVKTGIDLEKLNPNDIIIEGKDITINLPPIEILYFSMPPSGLSKIEELTDVSGPIPNRFTLDEYEEQFRNAELQIRNTVEYVKSEESVKRNTEKAIKVLLKGLEYENVSVNFFTEENLIK